MDGADTICAALLGLSLSLCLFYIVIQRSDALRSRFLSSPKSLQKLFVFFVVTPLFVTPFIAATRFSAGSHPMLILPAVSASVAGLGVILASFREIGVVPSIRDKADLVTTGVYAIVRHPIYSGTLLIYIGLLLWSRSLVNLVHLPLCLVAYAPMVAVEEKNLATEYGDAYRDYMARVRHRLFPLIY
jgi:protein-S-isoprenylcysteine O-methyltransferase Ste14